MKIDAHRLRTLRERKRFSRQQLSERSQTADPPGISARTIQRLENEPDKSKSTRKYTVMRLADALDVKPGVLTGQLPLPEPGEAAASEPDPVRIGAQIPPKVRLAYDLIKRRYGVNATDVIIMAPLFFVLLAEGSLDWRREKLKEALESFQRLEELDGYWSGSMADSSTVMKFGMAREGDSISKADLFGEHLCNIDPGDFGDSLFDPSIENPFATYLRKLGADLENSGVVAVDDGELDHRSGFKFPRYVICEEDMEKLTNASPDCRLGLELGILRISDIPAELLTESRSVERQKWLERQLSRNIDSINDDDFPSLSIVLETIHRLNTPYKENESRTKQPESDNKGDDQ